MGQVLELKPAREEIARMKLILAELTLDKSMPPDTLAKSLEVLTVSAAGRVPVKGLRPLREAFAFEITANRNLMGTETGRKSKV